MKRGGSPHQRRHRGPAFSFAGTPRRDAASPRVTALVEVDVAQAAGVWQRAEALSGNGHGAARDVLSLALLRGIASLEREANPLRVAPEVQEGRVPVRPPHADGAD